VASSTMRRLGPILSHIDSKNITVAYGTTAFDGKSLKGQVAVVTGAASGIGYAISEHLGLKGANVVLLDLAKDQLNSAIEKLRTKQLNVAGFSVDVTDEKQVEEVFQTIDKDYGRLDILVQSAGVTGKTGIKTPEVEVKDFQKVFAVNTTAIFLGCKFAIPIMLKRNYGRIVNLASIAGKEGNAGMLAYSSSKAAVIGLTKVIGKEYAETGITCNALAPAVVRTAMADALPEAQLKYMTDKIPMKRCGTLEEIAAMVAFIASPQASFTTGFTFDATGGRATY